MDEYRKTDEGKIERWESRGEVDLKALEDRKKALEEIEMITPQQMKTIFSLFSRPNKFKPISERIQALDEKIAKIKGVLDDIR